MKPNHINEQCAAMLGWSVETLLNGEDRYEEGYVLTYSHFVMWCKDFTPDTHRDHAFMVWDSLSEEEQEAVAREMCRNKSGYIVHIAAKAALDPETLCRSILDVRCPGWEKSK